MDLTGKAALVTGGAKRVGRAVALALAQQGCDVVIHYDRSAVEAGQMVAEIAALDRQAWSISADLSDEAAVNSLTPLALEQAGRLDILINNAAIFPAEDFLNANSTSWDRAMMINLKAPFLLSQAFARALPAGRPGKIINLLDTLALRPQNHHFSYTISKFGLAGLTQAMAVALAERNIQVNGLALGPILPAVDDDPALFDRLSKRIPARRRGSLEDVVQAVLFLLQGGDYVTGEILRLDGGWHLT
jgi:NAD(P)-dependent dehydrogenase (short-subunit alcohol dehydrogenase family)